MNDKSSGLPWDELWHVSGEIPWRALEVFAEAVAAEPDLTEELFETYDRAREVSLDKTCYADLYVLAILALAAPKLDEDQRRTIGEFLIKKLAEAGRKDDELIMEVLVDASGCMGPVVVPAVLDAIAAEPDSRGAWFHLWSLTALAAETDDNIIRDRTVQACVGLLERADRGEADVDIGFEAAHTLGMLGQTEYVALIQRLAEKCDPFLGRADYEEAAKLLTGTADRDKFPEAWQEPVREWFEPRWQTVRDWYARRAAEELEDMHAPPTEPRSKVRRFFRSTWARDLPDDLFDEAGFILDRLLDYAKKFEGAAPNELNEQVLRNVLLDVFPRRIAGRQDFFAKVAPVVEVFLEWMESEGLLENGSALAQAVRGWAEEIVAAGMNPEKWGRTKATVMEGEQTSVYVRDVEAMEDYWRQQALQSLEQETSDEEEQSPFTPTAPIVEHTPKIGRNEPCPCGSGKKYKKCCGNPAKGQTANV